MEELQREFDIIVFGASGFTGQYVVEEVARSNINETAPFKWAIAGRSKDKLTHVLNEASDELYYDLRNVQMIEADVANYESLLSMCKRTRIILNCVGPYRLYGEAVVKACVESGTHHLDISGEPQYLESMVLSYNKKAEEKGIYIIGACGWDSIPADLGVTYLKRHFDGEICSIEGYMTTEPSPEKITLNSGTWKSAVNAAGHFYEMRGLERRMNNEIFVKRPPLSKHKLRKKFLPFWSDDANGWCILFPGSDALVVKRTQLFQYINDNEYPIQFEYYLHFKSFLSVIRCFFASLFFGPFLICGCGRHLLIRFSKFFTCGGFSRKRPSREKMKRYKFEAILVANVWSKKFNDPKDEPNSPPNKKVYARIKGSDPAYYTTAMFLVQSAITILKESDKMPKPGGVLSPGYAFANTDIINRFHDVSFEILENLEL